MISFLKRCKRWIADKLGFKPAEAQEQAQEPEQPCRDVGIPRHCKGLNVNHPTFPKQRLRGPLSEDQLDRFNPAWGRRSDFFRG